MRASPHCYSYTLAELSAATVRDRQSVTRTLGRPAAALGVLMSSPNRSSHTHGIGIVAVTIAAGILFAQPPRQPRLESPIVGEDRRITFRVRAPQARAIVLNAPWAGEGKALTKNEDGVWSITVGPVPPAIYSYTFQMDGVRILDPHNTAVKHWSGGNASLVEVPSATPLAYDLRDVPHGSLHVHYYASESGGNNRRLHVYTPPGYEEDPDQHYPVLYLLHGSGDNDSTWSEIGKANLILDNLIAEGKAVPMLVVMPNGHPIPWSSGRRGLRSGNTEAFHDDLMEAAIPSVESRYRARADRSQRAIAGLSMGGGQSLHCGMRSLDRFAWVGAFSAGAPDPADDPLAKAFLADAERANAELKLLWIAIGRDDFLLQRNEAYTAALDSAGIVHTYKVTDGGHSWPVWRDYLAELAPLLFRD